MQAVRNVGVFLLFLLTLLFVGGVTDAVVISLSSNGVFGRDADVSYFLARALGEGIGSYLGVRAGVALINRFYKPYPSRVFAGTFICIAVSLLLLDLVFVLAYAGHFGASFWASFIGFVVSCTTIWQFLWRQPSEIELP